MAKLIETGPFKGLRKNGYRVIVMDVPWHFRTFSKKGAAKSASRHYKTMSLQEIAALPIEQLAHKKGCVLLFWSTGPMLEKAFDIINWYGFHYSAIAGWVKLTKTGSGINLGTGYHFRDSLELVLICRRGQRIPYKRPKPAISNVLPDRLREHSRKPDQFRSRVERLYRGPYLSLFERAERPGWTGWGDELGSLK